MQTMERPDGSLFRELFTEQQVRDGGMQRRRALLETQGMTFRKVEIVDRSKYFPHQGEKEIARRLKRMTEAVPA